MNLLMLLKNNLIHFRKKVQATTVYCMFHFCDDSTTMETSAMHTYQHFLNFQVETGR